MNYSSGWICILKKKGIFKLKIRVTLKPWRRAGMNSGVQQFVVKKTTYIIANMLLFFLFQEKNNCPFWTGWKRIPDESSLWTSKC